MTLTTLGDSDLIQLMTSFLGLTFLLFVDGRRCPTWRATGAPPASRCLTDRSTRSAAMTVSPYSTRWGRHFQKSSSLCCRKLEIYWFWVERGRFRVERGRFCGKRPNYYWLLITDWLIEFWGEAQEWKEADYIRCAHKSLTSCFFWWIKVLFWVSLCWWCYLSVHKYFGRSTCYVQKTT